MVLLEEGNVKEGVVAVDKPAHGKTRGEGVKKRHDRGRAVVLKEEALGDERILVLCVGAVILCAQAVEYHVGA